MTNRYASAARALLIAPLVFAFLGGTSVEAAPVDYTLRTVADGSLGIHVFRQAFLTIRMTADTASVQSTASPADPTRMVFTNSAGLATIAIDDGGRVYKATFEPGQIYVRYDTGAGVAGFGSAISPTYPIALDCSNWVYSSDTADCIRGEPWNLGTGNGDLVYEAGILAQLNAPYFPSAAVAALPQSLSASTLLTGDAHACAGPYSIVNVPVWDVGFNWGSDITVCGSPAPWGLRTDRGDLFLQDMVGGSNNPSVWRGGWDEANTGFLNVEVGVARAGDD